MKLNELRELIRREIPNILNEGDALQYKVKGILITDTTKRPQQDILSNIRALTGVTIVSSTEIEGQDYAQNNPNLRVILNLKIDGYPFSKHGGFSKDVIINKVIPAVRRVEGVKGFLVDPNNITLI
jgi:hypothetical protein